MTEFIDELKKEYEAAEKCHICLKEFNFENRKIRAQEIIFIIWVYIE